MANLLCMGLFLKNVSIPTPRFVCRRRDHTDHSLPSRVDMDMLNGDLLLSFAAMPVEGFEQNRMGT